MKYNLNGREVDVIDVQFERGEGAYITGAYFTDDGTDLTEAECDQLTNDYSEALYQSCCEDEAADSYDRAKDHMKYGDM